MANRKETGKFIPLVLMIVMFAVCYVIVITVLTPRRYDVRVGEVSAQTISAPRTIEDTAATEALRQAARAGAGEVSVLDEALVETYVTGASMFFTNVNELRTGAADKRAANEEGIPKAGTLSVAQWQVVLPEAQLAQALEAFTVPLTVEEGYWLLCADDGELLRLKDAVLPKLTTSLQTGLEAHAISARKAAYVQELNATSLSDELKEIGEKVLDTFLRPTYVVDEAATQKAREAAAAAVEPVEIKRGDVIVHQGNAVTQEEYDLLRALELVRAADADMHLNIGLGLFMVSLAVCFVMYLLIYQRRLFLNRKSMLIVGMAVCVSLLFSWLLNMIDYRINAALMGVMLVALLVDEKVAMAANVVLACLVGLIAGGRGAALLGFDSMVIMLSVLVGGQMAIYLLRKYNKRGTIIAAGVMGGVLSTAVVAAAGIMTSKTVSGVLVGAGWTMLSSLIAAVLVVGTLAIWETVFDVATSARLNELSSANHPLIRQLMTEAPGTYHHSMLTASLSEAAAEAIGADPLLARVGAYYHDVGKLRRPLYFKENQKPNENIHDTLPPTESAVSIIAHQKDGVLMLNKHKLPSAVVQIAFEHHGNTLVAYFYYKAQQENPGKQVSQKQFRYPGARPSTKESAIVMLADSCEAAVHSLDQPTREEVEAMVSKVIKGKFEDGQLNACPLNFKELSQVEQSFLRTFNGQMHDRIAYPDQQQEGSVR